MTAWSFLAIAGTEPVRRGLIDLRALDQNLSAEGLSRRIDFSDWTLFASPDAPILLLPRESGAILGRVFGAGGTSRTPVAAFPDGEAEAIATVGPRHLVQDYWGSYVALFDRSRHGGASLFRDPSGAVQAYRTEREGARVFASDPDLLLKLGLAASDVDREFLRQWLLHRHLRTARTGIAAISELLPGTAWVNGTAGPHVEAVWSPWPFGASSAQLKSFDQAAAALRSTALRTIPAYAEGAGKVLLELSGGLDSSIIAASLGNAGTRFAAVNFVTRSPDGDERRFARLAAGAAGARLIETFQEEPACGLLRLPRPTIRPGLSPVLAPVHQAFAEAALEAQADLFMSGAGGDSLFCYLTTAAPALDAFRLAGPAAMVRTLGDVSRLCGCTYWTAARHAVRKSLRRARPSWPADTRFLTREAAAALPDPHPWLDAPPGSLPGKRQHVEAIVTIFHFLDLDRRGSGAEVAYPLLAQPLVELCLRVPTWMWISGGRNRAVARRAFTGLVPDPILRRSGKGRLESMCAAAYERVRADLPPLLLDGRLAAEGLIDRSAVEDFLRREPGRSDLRYFRIFDLATLELWLRSQEER